MDNYAKIRRHVLFERINSLALISEEDYKRETNKEFLVALENINSRWTSKVYHWWFEKYRYNLEEVKKLYYLYEDRWAYYSLSTYDLFENIVHSADLYKARKRKLLQLERLGLSSDADYVLVSQEYIDFMASFEK